MIDRQSLRYFMAVIDAGNFSRAAAQCNVSQPTLSVAIAKMERELGQSLFHRNNRRVELTAGGARLAMHARRIETEFTLAEHAAHESTPRATLRLGFIVTLPARWIDGFIVALGAERERQPVELVEGRERDLIDHLARGRIDVALTIVRSESDRFASEILFTEGYSLAMPAEHKFAGQAVIDAQDLADNAMIVRRHCELLSDTSRHFTARGVRPFFAARTFSDERALGYVRSGLGVTVMPDSFIGEGIVRPKLADFPFKRDIGLLYGHHVDRMELRGGRTLTALIDSFASFGR